VVDMFEGLASARLYSLYMSTIYFGPVLGRKCNCIVRFLSLALAYIFLCSVPPISQLFWEDSLPHTVNHLCPDLVDGGGQCGLVLLLDSF
jgi:hypothetical protein